MKINQGDLGPQILAKIYALISDLLERPIGGVTSRAHIYKKLNFDFFMNAITNKKRIGVCAEKTLKENI